MDKSSTPPHKELVKLELRTVAIRPEPEFVQELWDVSNYAHHEIGQCIFVCHIQHGYQLSIDLRKSSYGAQGMFHVPLLDDNTKKYIFGDPIIYVKPSDSLYHLIKQCGVDLEERVIVTGQLSDRWVQACERYHKARTFYVDYGPRISPEEKP